MAEILKGKFNRLANDKSQLQQFGDEVCSALDNGEGGMVKPISEEGVEGLIQADKDIISQIREEYDENEDKTILTFPKGILPIKCYLNSINAYVYFNYNNNEIITEEGNELENTEIIVDYENGKVILTFNSELNELIDELIYLHFSRAIDDNVGCNWYKILIPSVYTKLYRHVVSFGDNNHTVSFTSTSRVALTSVAELVEAFYHLDDKTNFDFRQYDAGDQDEYLPVLFMNETSNLLNCGYLQTTGTFNIQSFDTTAYFTDTVTEL